MAVPHATPLGATDRASLLRTVLRGNALFSMLTGAALIVAAEPLATLLGIPSPLALRALGIALVPFALLVWRVAGSESQLVAWGWAILVADVLWVAGSGVLLAGGWLPLTPAGWWTIAILADTVALFALAEFVGLRRLK